MGDAAEVVRQLPSARTVLMDQRGVGLRATWHHDRGFANLSLWRGDRCEGTFRLAAADAAELIGFLVDGLGRRAGEPAAAPTVEPRTYEAAVPPTEVVTAVVRDLRRRAASWLTP